MNPNTPQIILEIISERIAALEDLLSFMAIYKPGRRIKSYQKILFLTRLARLLIHQKLAQIPSSDDLFLKQVICLVTGATDLSVKRHDFPRHRSFTHNLGDIPSLPRTSLHTDHPASSRLRVQKHNESSILGVISSCDSFIEFFATYLNTDNFIYAGYNSLVNTLFIIFEMIQTLLRNDNPSDSSFKDLYLPTLNEYLYIEFDLNININ